MTTTKAPLITSSVARRLERSEATIRSWVRDGRLRPIAVTTTGTKLFDPADIDRLAQELQGPR